MGWAPTRVLGPDGAQRQGVPLLGWEEGWARRTRRADSLSSGKVFRHCLAFSLGILWSLHKSQHLAFSAASHRCSGSSGPLFSLHPLCP